MSMIAPNAAHQGSTNAPRSSFACLVDCGFVKKDEQVMTEKHPGKHPKTNHMTWQRECVTSYEIHSHTYGDASQPPGIVSQAVTPLAASGLMTPMRPCSHRIVLGISG